MHIPRLYSYLAINRLAVLLCVLTLLAAPFAWASGPVTIVSQTQGATPFIENVTVDLPVGATVDLVYYTINSLPGSKTRPFQGSYTGKYLVSQGFQNGTTFNIPVPFLYAGRTNTVQFIFLLKVGKGISISVVNDAINTAPYIDPCNRLNTPTLQQNRISSSDLGFDFFLLKNYCSPDFPAVMDTDGNVRWVGTSKIGGSLSAIILNNGLYTSDGHSGVLRTEFDGRFRKIGDYAASDGVTWTGHHNYDPGRDGVLIDVNTTTQTESVNLEIDSTTGAVLNRWDLAQIISNAMIAGGDDPSTFVFPAGTDWFHNNSTTYRRADNTLLVSSRENFVIAVDYDTPADGIKKIHWILGDPTKHWYQYPSLRKYALTLGPETTAPIGQHTLSIDHNGNLMMFDDGHGSDFQQPAGISRTVSAGRIYTIDTTAMTATEVYTYEPQGKYSMYCGGFYEGSPGNYVIDYTQQNNGTTTEIQGLGASQKVVFDLQYPTASVCGAGFNALPLPGYLGQYQ